MTRAALVLALLLAGCGKPEPACCTAVPAATPTQTIPEKVEAIRAGIHALMEQRDECLGKLDACWRQCEGRP